MLVDAGADICGSEHYWTEQKKVAASLLAGGNHCRRLVVRPENGLLILSFPRASSGELAAQNKTTVGGELDILVSFLLLLYKPCIFFIFFNT